MRFLYVVDPLDGLNLETETSLLMMEEAARRGHANHVATLDGLYLADRGGRARHRAIALAPPGARPFYRLGDEVDAALADFDVVLMRKDPPVDEAYLAATFVLEHAGTRVINDPVALRTVNEKLLPLQFAVPTPPSLLCGEPRRIREFVAAHGRAILKPLNDCSGRGIRILASVDDVPADLAGRTVLVQKFIDRVIEGDKRILVVDGRAVGAVNRIPASLSALANIHQGARVEGTTITPEEARIVDTVAPRLAQDGLWMAGFDVIDGYLTEINVTSPSAARQINAVSGLHVERDLVDFVEKAARM
jgi:glutathione synthase